MGISASATIAEEATKALNIGDGGGWRFSGSPWSQDREGVVRPPNESNLHSRAFHLENACEDLTAEFEFNPSYRENGSGGAGLILRAQDANHFYAVYFPWCAQSLRAKNFWASIVKVDGDGYLRSLKSVWVPGVPSETERWYKVKVVAKGPHIDVWVDGRKALGVTDDSYKSGAVGLIGYGWYLFRNFTIQGPAEALPDWPEKIDVPTHAFTVGLNSEHPQYAFVTPNGDVLIASGNQLVRSTDRGRTWNSPEQLPGFLEPTRVMQRAIFCTRDGRVLTQIWHEQRANPQDGSGPEIFYSESTDNGLTWSELKPAEVESGWPSVPEDIGGYNSAPVQTDDGTWVQFCGGSMLKERAGNIVTWGGAAHYKAFATRSTNQGKTWSKPIEIDQPYFWNQPRRTIPGAQDFTEPCGLALGNRVMAIVRPVYSPYMWQCWSHDAGATWDSAARTTFTGYGGGVLVKTQNGTILCGHRMPHYSINLSSDDGLNWDEGTIIDYPNWAMGAMVEVEPNIVLCTYMNAIRSNPLLAQFVRVHPDRIEPVTP